MRKTFLVYLFSVALIGKKLRIYFDIRDIRSMKAFFDDGAELGVLIAGRPWCYTPHSVRVRQEIFRLKRKGKLNYRDGDDPVEAWEKYKHAQAKTNKRAATELAKAKSDRHTLASGQHPTNWPPPMLAPPAHPRTPTIVPEELPAKMEMEPTAPPQPRALKIKRTFTF